jgi:hypothetical protein
MLAIFVEGECDRILKLEGLRVVPKEVVDVRFRFDLVDVVEFVSPSVPRCPQRCRAPWRKPYEESKRAAGWQRTRTRFSSPHVTNHAGTAGKVFVSVRNSGQLGRYWADFTASSSTSDLGSRGRFGRNPSQRRDHGLRSLCRSGYSFNDTGSDSFFGDVLFNRETHSLPAAGTPALPSRTISLAVKLWP